MTPITHTLRSARSLLAILLALAVALTALPESVSALPNVN